MSVFNHGISVLVSFLQSDLGKMYLLLPAIAVGADFLTGVIRALLNRSFRLAFVGDFLHSQVLPYLAIIAALVVPTLSGVPIEASAAISSAALLAWLASQLGSIAENIGEMFGVPQATVMLAIKLILGRFFPGVQVPLETVNNTSESSDSVAHGPEGPAA
jgi:hypothetical protein